MSTTLVLLLVVIGAYLAAHVAFEWLAERFLVVSGAEYLLLGILLGPEVSGFIQPGTVGEFAPFMTLALGWIGTVVGAQFYVPGLLQIRGRHFRVATVEAFLSLVLVSAALLGALVWLLDLSVTAAAVPAVGLGAIATASAPSGIALAARETRRSKPVHRQLEVTTAVDAAVSILALGVLLSVAHAGDVAAARPPTATEWVVISVAIGVVGGALFHLFLGEETKIDRLFIGLAGAVILASGAAAYLRLSPLLPTMLVGAILVNTAAANRDAILEVLQRVERPLYFVLLIFAGAAWEPVAGGALLVVLLFLVVRTAAKPAAAWAGAASLRAVPELGAGWGRALLGHGGLAVAIGLNYRLLSDLPHAGIVFTATIVSVLLTDFTSAWLARPVVFRGPSRAATAAGAEGEASGRSEAGSGTAREGDGPGSGSHEAGGG